jgi:hypothetical protein
MEKYARVLCISDLHFPYSHKDCLKFLKALIDKYDPDKFVLLGDEADYHALSFHSSDPDLDSAGVELTQTLGYMDSLYELLYGDVDVCESNHGSMAYRKQKFHGMPRHLMRSYKEVLVAPDNWNWHPEIKLKMSNNTYTKFVHGRKKNVLTYEYNKLFSSLPILSHAIIENGIPKLLPMFLNKWGRWNGQIP